MKVRVSKPLRRHDDRSPGISRSSVNPKCGQVGGRSRKYRVVRQNVSEFLQYGRIFDKDGRGVESEPSSASATPMDVDAVGKGSERLQAQSR